MSNVLKQQLDMQSIIQIAKENNLSFDSVKQVVQSYFRLKNSDSIMKNEDFFRKITTSQEVASLCRNKNGDLSVETAHFLMLNEKQELIDMFAVKGREDCVEFEVPSLMKEILMTDNVKYVILAHNHPSGFVTPSNPDISFSQHMIKMLKPFQISLIDSVIYSERTYYSMLQNELLEDSNFFATEKLEKQRSLDGFAQRCIEKYPGYSLCHSNEKTNTFTILDKNKNVVSTNVDVFVEDVNTIINKYESKKIKKSRSLSM